MFKKLGLIACWLVFSSCATHINSILPIQDKIRNGQCDSALAELEKLATPQTDDQLLYLMEYGSASQICGDFKKSNLILQQADKLSDDLDYVSVSRGVGATLFNEQVLQYKGDKFERLLINAMTALNYLELNDTENAMVEVRRINEKTKKFAENEKRSFELNSFASYLSGLIYEFDKRFDDACISYRAAYNLDKTFPAVARDLMSACWRAHRGEEFKEIVASVGASGDEIAAAKDTKAKKNEKIIIFLQGWGPKKIPRYGDVRFPSLTPSFSQTKRLLAVAADADNNFVHGSNQVYNVEKAAIQTMEEDYKTLGARRFGARIAKEVVAAQIRQKDKTLGDIAWLVMVASEHADLRNWALLPESVQVLRINSDEVKRVRLSGRSYDDTETEDLGVIDFSEKPAKKIYIVRSLK